MKKYKINEIFYSLQGEGHFAGTPSIFIRFSDCNLSCHFCDTEFKSGDEYSMEEIFEKIRAYKSTIILLTGGEPMLQVDESLCLFFKKQGYTLHIETNGTIKLPKQIDWVTVSPKNKNWLVRGGNELKLVYSGQDLNYYENFQFDHYFLQPLSLSNTMECVNKVKENPKWKLSLQIQKLIGIK